MRSKWWYSIFAMLAVMMSLLAPANAAVPTNEQMAAVIAGGQKHLLNQFISDSDTQGHWGSSKPLAQTAAAVAALLETGKYSDAAYKTVIDKGIQYILAHRNVGNGGIYVSDEMYETGLSLVALNLYGKAATVDAAYDAIVLAAVNYLKNAQYADGGWSYSPCNSPCTYTGSDISNTQFAVMGLYFGSKHLGLAIDATAAGTWPAKLYGYLQNNQQADGHFTYSGGYAISSTTATGAGLWSLFMIGKEQSAEVTKGLAWYATYYAAQPTGSARWLNAESDGGTKNRDFYFVYAMAKGLTGVLGSNNLLGGTYDWLTDLKEFIYTYAAENTATTPSSYSWSDDNWLYSYGDLTTAWALMSMTFADPNTPAETKRVAEPVTTDVPVANQGTVTLEATGGVLISAPARGNIDAATKEASVELPIGSFEFTLTNVTPGGTAVLRIVPAAGSLDPANPNGFLKADGTIKPGLTWFKIIGGAWQGLPSVPITLGPVGGPYTYIEITLTDGGPEDTNPAAGIIGDPGAPGVGFVAAAPAASGDDSRCFIATAAYGSSMAPDVMVLRHFRDRFLKTNAFGRMLVDAYYSVSPPIAAFIAHNDTLRAATRVALAPVIFTVKNPLEALGILFMAALAGMFWVRRRGDLL